MRQTQTWETRITNIVKKNPRIQAIQIVDILSRETFLSSRWGKTDALRTVQDLANNGELVREWDDQGEVYYRVA